MLPMYTAKVNSPGTSLKIGINSTETNIQLNDVSVLPPAPNIFTIGEEEDAETVEYLENPIGDTVIVSRGFEGIAKSWVQGSPCARVYTAYDHNTTKYNIENISVGGVDKIKTINKTSGMVTSVEMVSGKSITYVRDTNGKIIDWSVN